VTSWHQSGCPQALTMAHVAWSMRPESHARRRYSTCDPSSAVGTTVISNTALDGGPALVALTLARRRGGSSSRR
jgi:hypothetical protein